jgi:hypothetical protein
MGLVCCHDSSTIFSVPRVWKGCATLFYVTEASYGVSWRQYVPPERRKPFPQIYGFRTRRKDTKIVNLSWLVWNLIFYIWMLYFFAIQMELRPQSGLYRPYNRSISKPSWSIILLQATRKWEIKLDSVIMKQRMWYVWPYCDNVFFQHFPQAAYRHMHACEWSLMTNIASWRCAVRRTVRAYEYFFAWNPSGPSWVINPIATLASANFRRHVCTPPNTFRSPCTEILTHYHHHTVGFTWMDRWGVRLFQMTSF